MDNHRLQEELRQVRQELLLLYEIGNLIRTTLLYDEVMYLILSAVTSHQGMGFNRAFLFMVDESGAYLEGKMAIGPANPAASAEVWQIIEDHKINLEGLLDVYHKSNKAIDVELNDITRQVRIPIEKDFGALAKTAIYDHPMIVQGEDVNHEVTDMRLRNLDMSQFATVPIRGKDHVLGVLLVDNVSTRKAITDADVRRLMMLANHAGLALENAKTYSDVVITAQQDSLTKLWNHGSFQKTLAEHLKDSKISKKNMSLVLFDVDNFKAFNDEHGHQAGDRALEQISKIAKSLMRRQDYLARYGGEEFAVILPDTSKEEAVKLADRLRKAIEKETDFAPRNLVPAKITVSMGVSSFPEDADEKEKLIYCADGALYDAKRSGRNTVREFKK